MTLVLEAGKLAKPNDVMIVENLGMSDFRSPGIIGKLYLIISIKFPNEIEESKLESLTKVMLIKVMFNRASKR